MRWPSYAEYKSSGTEWLGSIPSHWSTTRLKWSTSLVTSGSRGWAQYYADDGDYFVRIGNLTRDRLDFDDSDVHHVQIPPATEGSRAMTHTGDLLFSITAYLGSVAVVDDSHAGAFVSQHIALVRLPGVKLDPWFAGYVALSDAGQRQLREQAYGGTKIQLGLEDIRDLVLPLPEAAEQHLIVTFLDREVAQVDALIAKQEQLIVTLREDRIANITHAVTRGLDPAAKLVQPSDEALPACPRHWTQQISLKRVASVQTGLTLGKTVGLEDAVTVPYLRVANVQTSGVDLGEVKTVEVHRTDVHKYLLRTGDVLMTEGGDIDKLGRGCVWAGEISPCVHQNHVFAVRCSDRLASGFLVYLLDTSVARNYFFMTAKKTTNLASTNSTTLGAFTFSLPPRAEQNLIVKFLDERCSQLDALITKAHEVIVVLREYRSALVTDAVTGKIDVRAAA